MPSPDFSIDLDSLREKLDPTPCGIVRELARAGFEAYIVGGAVRDLLIGASPKDYDISTNATPEQVKRVFGHRRCHIIGRRFRLAHVYADNKLYEVSTFRRRPSASERKGKYESDGVMIWNDNCFGTLQDDAGRRDFTVNALFFDVVGSQGVIDLHGGLEDIRHGIVRAIGRPAERMDEDPVRMLRALKLVAQNGFVLEPQLERVLREHAAKITMASPARLFEELLKIFNHPAAPRTLEVMHQYGFLKHFWPTLDASWDEQEGTVVRHLLKLRGEAMRRGVYSNSRGLALSTVTMPFMMAAMNPEHPGDFWSGSLHLDDVAPRVLEVLFEGFMVPRVLSERVLTILDLVPKLLKRPISPRAMGNVEYRYARALGALLVQAFGWDPQLIVELPDGYEGQQLTRGILRGKSAPKPLPADDADDADGADGAGDAGGIADDGNTITFTPPPNTADEARAEAKRQRRRRRRERQKHLRQLARQANDAFTTPDTEQL